MSNFLKGIKMGKHLRGAESAEDTQEPTADACASGVFNTARLFGDWEERSSSTPDVFRPVVEIKPQGQDGQAHFAFFDYDRQLSFVWNGQWDEKILVSWGGYGEPAKWAFSYHEMYEAWRAYNDFDYDPNANPCVRNFGEAIMQYQKICKHWIVEQEKSE